MKTTQDRVEYVLWGTSVQRARLTPLNVLLVPLTPLIASLNAKVVLQVIIVLQVQQSMQTSYAHKDIIAQVVHSMIMKIHVHLEHIMEFLVLTLKLLVYCVLLVCTVKALV